MRTLVLLMASLLVGATLAAAQEGPKNPTPTPPATTTTPVESPASAARDHVNVAGDAFVGQLAPDFTIDGAMARPVQLSKLRGDWVVLVFADRRAALEGLAREVADLRLLGGVFLGVCHDKARTIEQAQQRDPMPFLIAADPTGEVSAMYGAYDSVHTTTSPAFFVLDRRGTVRLSVLGQTVPPEEILMLAKIPMGVTQ